MEITTKELSKDEGNTIPITGALKKGISVFWMLEFPIREGQQQSCRLLHSKWGRQLEFLRRLIRLSCEIASLDLKGPVSTKVNNLTFKGSRCS